MQNLTQMMDFAISTARIIPRSIIIDRLIKSLESYSLDKESKTNMYDLYANSILLFASLHLSMELITDAELNAINKEAHERTEKAGSLLTKEDKERIENTFKQMINEIKSSSQN